MNRRVGPHGAPVGPLPRLRAAVAVLLAVLFALTTPLVAAAAPAHADRSKNAPPIRISVLSVTPTSPALSETPKPLKVVLAVTNVTAKPLAKLEIRAERGDPIQSQQGLDKSFVKAQWPSNGLPVAAKRAVRVNLAAGATARVTFATDTDIPEDAGICICHQAVYPLFFGAFTHSDGTRLGYARTYLPVFSSKPAPVRVAWVWPLIDRPHRATSDTVFTDDDLAGLVASGGRLDRSLAVLELVGKQGVPVTVLLDPELIDELVVMSRHPGYAVRTSPTSTSSPGVGSAAASAWLDRLRVLLTNHPGVQVELTPYADPDVQTLSARHLGWAPKLAGTQMTARVTDALAGRPLAFDTAWPAGGVIGMDALQRLRGNGVRTLVLDAAAVSQQQSPVPAGVARLRSGGTQIAAALLSPTLQTYVEKVLTNSGGTGLSQLPDLAAQIAIRAAQEPDVEHQVVLAAPRYVDPDVATASRAIIDTTHAPYAVGSPLTDVTAKTRLPSATATLARTPAGAVQLPGAIVDVTNEAGTAIPTIDSLLGADPVAKSVVLPGLPVGVQRSASAAFQIQRTLGTARAAQLSRTFGDLLGGVRIVRPTSGSYTLGSSNSKLPITVQNDLAYTVRVRVLIQTVNDVPGFDAVDNKTHEIGPRTKQTLHLSTEVSRAGRIPIEAQLQTPDAESVGPSQNLTVHSTAFGVIGVVITVVAGAVLVIALLVRFARRVRRRAPAAPSPRVPVDSDPVGTGRTR